MALKEKELETSIKETIGKEECLLQREVLVFVFWKSQRCMTLNSLTLLKKIIYSIAPAPLVLNYCNIYKSSLYSVPFDLRKH